MDIVAGSIVGIAQILVGHPFDSAKVLIQNKQNWRNLPWRSYYKGCSYPFVASIIFNAMVFPIHDRSLQYTSSHSLSGTLGGIIVAPILQVLDLAKVKRQTNKPLNMYILRTNKGMSMSILRESSALSIYFGSYHYLKSQEMSTLAAGGCAGLLNWAFTYPIDVIRSRQLSQNIKISTAIQQGHLWKGFNICMARAFIVNSISFYIYELF